jgi:hypothetical protein
MTDVRGRTAVVLKQATDKYWMALELWLWKNILE